MRISDWGSVVCSSALLAPLLGVFERRNPAREAGDKAAMGHHGMDVIVFGLGRYGGTILQLLRDQGLRVLGVDFSPSVVRRWRAEGVDTLYGNIAVDRKSVEKGKSV